MQTYFEILKYSLIISTSFSIFTMLLHNFCPTAIAMRKHFERINKVIASEDLILNTHKGWLVSRRFGYHVKMANFPLKTVNLLNPSFFIQSLILGPIQVVLTGLVFFMSFKVLNQDGSSDIEEMDREFILRLENGIIARNYDLILTDHLMALCNDNSWENESVYIDFFNAHSASIMKAA